MNLIYYSKQKKVRQILLLFITSAFGMVSMLCINYFLAKLLTKEQFGNYSLLINLFMFAQVIFNFGIFQSLSRMIALTDLEKEKREYYGIGIIFVFLLYLIMSICLIAYAFTSSNINSNGMVSTLLIAIPFGWIYLFTNFNELLLQGSNQIGLLSNSRLVPRLVFVILLGIIAYRNLSPTLNDIVILYFSSYLVSYIYIIYSIKPLFKNIKSRFIEVIAANKKFGFNIYIGALVAVGMSSLSGILIGYFGVNNISVGYFTIACQLCAPLAMIPNVMATVYFKKFANSHKIDKRLIFLMFVIIVVALFIIFLLAEPIVNIIYGPSYYDAISLIKLSAIGFLLYGVGDFFNRFLLANGKGKELRNTSFYVGTTLLIANFVLIKYYAAEGAAVAKIIAGIIYSLVILYYYNLTVKQNILK